MGSVRLVLAVAGIFAALPAQRPRTVDEALAKLADVQDRPEGDRLRAVGDLGDFADDAATSKLVEVLARAEGLALRQAAARALGEHARPAAVEPLRRALAAAANARLCETLAGALAAQGEAGVAALVALLDAENGGSARRNAICDGLGRATGGAARDAL